MSKHFQQTPESLLKNLRISLKQDLQDYQELLINSLIMVFNLENLVNPVNPVSDNLFCSLLKRKDAQRTQGERLFF